MIEIRISLTLGNLYLARELACCAQFLMHGRSIKGREGLEAKSKIF